MSLQFHTNFFVIFSYTLEIKNIIVGYLNKGYPHSTTKKDKPLRKLRQGSAHVGTTSQNHARNASTTFQLARGLLDGTPRPQGNLRLVRPWGRAGRPVSPTNFQTKVKAFNATVNHFLPPWLQRRQHGSGTSVKSHFLPPIPG
jgi:hypothetical protein